MTASLKKYTIGHNRLANGFFVGFRLAEGGAVRTLADEPTHLLFLGQLDSVQPDCPWGRLVFTADLPSDMALVVHAFASNENEILYNGRKVRVDDFLRDANLPLLHKQKLFETAGATRTVGATDLLLYEQEGRYLWTAVELVGSGDAELRDFRFYLPGDTFFHTFPEVYRNNGEFLHRYLSVFSSLYNDLQETIDALPSLLNLETAPVGLLPIFADWMGLRLDGNFLTESQTRRLLREAFRLSAVKGTRSAIEGVLHILIAEPFYLVEHKATDAYSFSVLVCREPDERLHAQLKFLIGQFTSVRSEVELVFLGGCSRMDTHCYLDINAAAARISAGCLDSRAALNGLNFLK